MTEPSNTTATASGKKFMTGKVLTLSACHFVHDIYSSLFAPLLPLLIEKLSMSLAQAGFLSTVMQAPSLLGPLIGMLADRKNVRYFIIFAPAATAVPMSFTGLAPNYGVLLILLFVTGVSTALFHVPAPVWVASLSGDKKGKGMSFYMTGGELARTLGPLAAVGIVSVFGLEGFYPIMIFGLMASAWLFFRFRDVPVRANTPGRPSLVSTFREVRHVMAPLVAILIARAFMYTSMTVFLPTFIKQETGNMWLAGSALTALEALGVAAVLSSGTLSDIIGRKRVLFAALIGAPVSILLFALTGGALRFVALLATGFTLLSTTPVMLAMVQENAGSSPAAANGLFIMVSFFARSAIVVFVGLVADSVGLRATYIISACIGVLGIPFVFMLPREKKRSDSGPARGKPNQT